MEEGPLNAPVSGLEVPDLRRRLFRIPKRVDHQFLDQEFTEL